MKSESLLIVTLILIKVFVIGLKNANADIWTTCDNSFTPKYALNYNTHFLVYEGENIEATNPLYRCGDTNYPNYVTI